MLKLQSIAPEWLGSIPSQDEADPRPFLMTGVRMAFNPIEDDVFEQAQAAIVAELADGGDNLKGLKAAQTILLRAGISAWEGIGDAAGKQAAVTPGTIESVIRDPRIRRHMVDAYITPFLLWDAEGNGSAGSPDGIGAKATPEKITAASRAKRQKAPAVRNARIASTRPKAARAKASGN